MYFSMNSETSFKVRSLVTSMGCEFLRSERHMCLARLRQDTVTLNPYVKKQ